MDLMKKRLSNLESSSLESLNKSKSNRTVKVIQLDTITKKEKSGTSKIESETNIGSKKKQYFTKKEAPKLVKNELIYKDYLLFLQENTLKLKEFAIEYLKCQTDKERIDLLENDKEIKERYTESIDRYINNSKLITLTEKLHTFQKETGKMFEEYLKESQKTIYETAIKDIERFKEASKRSAKIKKNYIVAIKSLETLQKQTKIKVLDLFEIDTPIEEYTSKDLFIVSINKQITDIKELRNKINNEKRIISDKISTAKHLARETKNKIIHQLLNQPQEGNFKDINWSKLDNEQKENRIHSYVKSVVYSNVWNKINETNVINKYTLSSEIEEKSNEFIETKTKELLEKILNKEIKYNKIRWKKQDGILTKINCETTDLSLPADLNDLIEKF